MILPFTEVNGAWQHTWTHPSFHDAMNTALSLDHIVAEGFMELVTSVPVFLIGRWTVRRHDERHHGGPILLRGRGR